MLTSALSRFPVFPFSLIVALAFALRVWGLAGLHNFGDGAYSVYLAGLDVPALLRATAADSHPPLYYLLLHYWMALVGPSELGVRFLSLVPGVLVVALSARLMGRLLGDEVGRLSALLVAVSPFLVYYSRLPRMYALVVLLVLLSVWWFWQSLHRGRTRDWALYTLAITLALYTHYFAALAVLAEGLILVSLVGRRWGEAPVVGHREDDAQEVEASAETPGARPVVETLPATSLQGERKRGGRVFALISPGTPLAPLAASWLATGFLFLPWLIYAFLPSAAFTAANIANAPPPSGTLGFLQQFLIPFHLGVAVDRTLGRWLLLAFALIWAGAWYARRQGAGAGKDRWSVDQGGLLLSGLVALPLLAAYAIFLVFPQFGRQRFLLFATPAYLALLALALVWIGRWRRPVGVLAVGLVLAVSGYALQQSYYVERHLLEADAVQVLDRVEDLAQAGDGVILHAFWQIGYFRSHYDGPSLAYYPLGEVTDGATESEIETAARRLLQRHSRLWLAMYGAGRRDPDYPLEAWLDRNLGKAQAWEFGRTRLALYVAAGNEGESAGTATPATTFARDGDPVLRLEAVADRPEIVRPGDAVGLRLRWRALAEGTRRYSAFLHLDDPGGRTWAGRDGEPQEGLAPTHLWTRDQVIEESRGFVVPGEVPAGSYDLVLGVYDVETRAPLLTSSGQADRVVLGPVQVTAAQPERLRIARPLQADFDGQAALIGWGLDLDRREPIETRVVNGLLDTPIALTLFRQAYQPGETMQLTLYWQRRGPLSEDYTVFTHLLDAQGKVVAQKDNPPVEGRRPTSGWGENEVLVDGYAIALPPDLPPGEYRLEVGLYRPRDGQRLLLRPDGRGRRENRLVLGMIRVATNGVTRP